MMELAVNVALGRAIFLFLHHGLFRNAQSVVLNRASRPWLEAVPIADEIIFLQRQNPLKKNLYMYVCISSIFY